jgi:hypothetical protein
MAEDEEAADEAAVSTLSEPTLKGTRRLVVPLPERSRRASAVEVRVRDVFRERELREKVPIPANASEVGLDLPAAWLGTGSYEIDLYSDDSRLLSRTTLTAR